MRSLECSPHPQFLYFVIHIPITIMFDSQGVLPGHLYPAGEAMARLCLLMCRGMLYVTTWCEKPPAGLRGMVADYLRGTCDPIMGGSTGAIPVWAWSFIS